jgi:dTDP-4-amino-4,6-dideoxygalactose transaminase
MIPRTKVNYRLSDLLKAFFIQESSGQFQQRLHHQLIKLLGTPNILLTASGRGALYILLKCLPQCRVLIPAYTCKAVAEAAHLAGKEVLYGETELNGFNMSTDSLKDILNADTILIATHQFGIPCDIHAMIQYAREVGAFVIEDAAASLGSRINGQLTGTFGDAAFFSFDSTKLVNVPIKGGVLRVKDSELFTHCVTFQNKNNSIMPLSRKIHYLLLGAVLITIEHPTLYRIFHNLKFHWRGRYTDDNDVFSPRFNPFYLDRLSEWQAAILIPQVNQLDQIIADRQRLYNEYIQKLQGIESFTLPPTDSNNEWAPIRFPIIINDDKLNFYRKGTRLGIDFAFSFTFIASPVSFIRSHKLASSILDIPFYKHLADTELNQVVAVLYKLNAENKSRV